MTGIFTQLYVHVVFAVKGRQNLIQNEWKDELHRYISGIISGKGQKAIIVNGVADHVHCFIGIKPSIAISDLVRDIKNNSSKFVNEKKFLKGKFQWQEGYGCFSYSQSQIKQLYDYILHQEDHHKTRTFKEEYLDLLNKFEIEYKPEYLFNWIE